MQKKKLEWCKEKKLLKKITPNNLLAKKHIAKAKHNISAANYNLKGGFSDWSISQAYYAAYHSLLAILYFSGYESTNHECTIIAVEFLINKNLIRLAINDIAFIRTAEKMKDSDAKALREQFQYGVETSINTDIVNLLLEKTKNLLEKVEINIENKI